MHGYGDTRAVQRGSSKEVWVCVWPPETGELSVAGDTRDLVLEKKAYQKCELAGKE